MLNPQTENRANGVSRGVSRVPVTAILSNEIVSAQGQRIGFLKELVIDVEAGAIAYAVLSVGGLFGLGSRLYAVPWNTLARGTHYFVLREALRPEQLLDDLEPATPPWLAAAEDAGIRLPERGVAPENPKS